MNKKTFKRYPLKSPPQLPGDISGAVFRYVDTSLGKHWMDGEDVVMVTLKSDKDGYASYHQVIDMATAYELKCQLDRLCGLQMREWAKNQFAKR